MTSLDSLAELFRQADAFVISNHDFKTQGLVMSAVIPAKNLVSLGRSLCAGGYSLLDISTLEASEGFLLTYHFDNINQPGRLAVRLLAPTGKPVVPSLCDVFQGAEWHERESRDFYGVVFDGNPNPLPLLLAEDFDGSPPLRKNPKDLAPLSALGLFGQPQSVDPAWEAYVNPPAKESSPKAEKQA
ncbi:MAG: NADH-quinone oxidoreductase subunit C [Deltaproteobacteria bacterium]|jgi:NADH-quinone oxidoreductase subunit C|nr:NADH-quinone oxidoreductase subunit C [Deltaproteobacteria bacterium]